LKAELMWEIFKRMMTQTISLHFKEPTQKAMFSKSAINKEVEQGGAPNAHPCHAGVLARFPRGIRRATGERG
jgi:hypothetical protein